MPGRRLLLGSAYLLFLLVVAESGARLFWRLKEGAPLLAPDRLIYRYYPALDPVESAPPRVPGGPAEVLLLGGSVVTQWWGDIPARLQAGLRARLGREVVVYSVAGNAHTSLDSVVKYERLAGRRFDLVVVYDGANDIRANMCPAEVFRPDYSHLGWYRLLGQVRRHPELAYFALPFTLDHLLSALGCIGGCRSMPDGLPPPDWVAEARELKTPPVLEANLRRILALGAERGEPVVLLTIAWHIPSDYSPERFQARALDYGRHKLALLGRPADMAAAFRAHNEVIRRVAATAVHGPRVRLVDLDSILPRGSQYFDDPVHLTADGCQAFVAALLPTAEELIRRQPSRH